MASGGVWTQIGSDINGDFEGDRSGFSLSLSGDGKRVAIGSPYRDDIAGESGHVKVYQITPNDCPVGVDDAYSLDQGTELTVDIAQGVLANDTDADGDTFAISGTKMRRAAFAGDFKTFRSGIPTLNDNECRAMMVEIAAKLPANFK